MLAQAGEKRIHRGHVGDVARQHDVRAKLFRQRAHTLFQRLALVGECKLCTGIGEGLGDPPGDRLVVRQAHDQAALARHQCI